MGQVMAQGLGACPQFSLVALVDLHEPAELFGARYVATLDGLDPVSYTHLDVYKRQCGA